MQIYTITRKSRWFKVAVMMLWVCIIPPAWAHDTGAHSQNNPTTAIDLGPIPAQTFVATSHDMEAVGIVDNHLLTIYIDQHDSNEPVVQAGVELKVGNQVFQAKESTPGVYTVDIDGLPLTDAGIGAVLIVRTSDELEQLTGVLRSSSDDHHGNSYLWVYLLLAIGLICGLSIWFAYKWGIRLTVLKTRVSKIMRGLK